MYQNNFLSKILNTQSFIPLDGAMATELEARGCDIADSLWSAKVLIENPDFIRDVHLDYFRAGAEIAITASYQATPQGFKQKGLDKDQACELIKKSVVLAKQARDEYRKENPTDKTLLIAGSIGPYGAYLSDGSEYTGNYTLTIDEFIAFHRPRLDALIDAGTDLLACETLPSFIEICALIKLLAEYPSAKAWISVTLKDSQHLSDGTPLKDLVALVEDSPQIISIGVNCISIEKTIDAIAYLHHLTALPLIAYPNLGEDYDPINKIWCQHYNHDELHKTLTDSLPILLSSGAKFIGGCCRTSPKDIRNLVSML